MNNFIAPIGTKKKAGQVMFNAAAYSGLQFWYNSQNVVLDNTGQVSVAQWTDLSGNARHATQATKALQPKYVANVQNNYPALVFAATEYMNNTYVSELGSMFVVGRSVADGNHRAVYGVDSTLPAFGNMYIKLSNPLNRLEAALTYTDDTVFGSSGEVNPTRYMVAALEFDGSSITIWRDNGATTNEATPVKTRSTADTAAGVRNPVIGAAYFGHGVADPLSGGLLEIAYYSPKLTSQNTIKVITNLRDKYGI